MSTQTTTSTDSAPTHGATVEDLIEQEGTIPFRGLSSVAPYPDNVALSGARHTSGDPRPFVDAITVLPQAGEGDLWADNEFVAATGDGQVDIDLEAIEDIHAFDVDDIEQTTGRSLDELANTASPESVISVDDYKDIIDRRRLALRTLGFECKFRWQIASSGYNPGDMQQFFRRKIAACQKNGLEDAFGWIHHYDWGGSVVMTTIYPEMDYEIGLPEDDIEIDGDKFTITDEPVDQAVEGDLNNNEGDPASTQTVYYGDRIGYDFRGSSTIWAYPVVFVPSYNVMVPLPSPRFSRRHEGEFMDVSSEREEGRRSPLEWHENIISKIDSLTGTVNTEILRARVAAIDFSELPFDIPEFYEYLGLPASYAEPAAQKAQAIASPANQPSIWTLQLSLKLVLLDEFSGARAGDSFQNYQEIAGQLLRFPAQQIKMALTEHDMRTAGENGEEQDGEPLVEDQTTLAESLDDVVDLPGVTEDDVTATEAEQLEQQIQQRLSRFDD